ncbi:hypothetical protein LP419_00260 [Massilia sp. H-1]|nr:hypothetical protein LP419_00260 [Massilia sp. H-1]
MFALAVTASVQLVGVYLVFASLIVPSLAVRHYPERRKLPLAYLTGIGGYAAKPGAVGDARSAVRCADRVVPGLAGHGGLQRRSETCPRRVTFPCCLQTPP